MLTTLFAAAVLAISLQGAAATSCSRSYVVQPGDYCDKISQAQNVSTYQLAVVNHNTVDATCNNLLPGQTLCLAQTPAEDCTTTYIVRAGDTCSDIASRAGLNTTVLYLNNPQIDENCSNIYTNEVLCIAPTVCAPPIPAGGVAVTAPSTTQIVAPTTTVPAATVSSVFLPITPTAAPSTHAVVPTTPAVSPTTHTAASSTHTAAPSGSDDECDNDDGSEGDNDEDDCDDEGSDGGDDDDLPFCDEL